MIRTLRNGIAPLAILVTLAFGSAALAAGTGTGSGTTTADTKPAPTKHENPCHHECKTKAHAEKKDCMAKGGSKSDCTKKATDMKTTCYKECDTPK